MGDPPTMELSIGNTSLPEVLVVLPTNSGHRPLKAGQFILQVFKSIHQNVQLSGLLAHQLPQLVGLENGT